MDTPKTLDEVAALLRAADARELFGEQPTATYNKLVMLCHPDHNPDRLAEAKAVFQQLEKLFASLSAPPVTIKSPKRVYEVKRTLAIGDVADVSLAEWSDGKDTHKYVVKASRILAGAAMLEAEHTAIAAILTKMGDYSYNAYFPTICESFPIRDKIQKRVNVFMWEDGWYSATQVREKYQLGVDGRHIAWMFKRLLVALGAAHASGYVHGAVLPEHFLVNADNHGGRLVGWGQSVKIGETVKIISRQYRDWYPPEILNKQPVSPATDIYMAARVARFLCGAAASDMFPATIPTGIQRFLQGCLLGGQTMRPQDAWALHDEYASLLGTIYGKPRFHSLVMS